MAALINFVCFQAAWFLNLQSAAAGRPWIGVLAAAAFLLLQMRLSATPFADLRLAGLAALGGLFVDSSFIQLQLLDYASPGPLPALAPAWILAMWAIFGLTLNSSLRWLQGRWPLAALLGAVGGPLAYLAGVRIGAASIAASPPVVYGALALAWALATPLLLGAAARFAQQERGAAPAKK